MSLGFHVATDHCYGCKTCTVGCANEHLLNPGVLLRRVRQIDASDPIGHAFVSMSCNHCDEPVCVANCPVGAYTKQEDTGLVIQDHSLCIGCKTCIEACPFSAPSYDEISSTTYKCDGLHRSPSRRPASCMHGCLPGMRTSLWTSFETLSSTHADSASVKEVVDTMPNLIVSLDPDITVEVFTDIDGWEETVDRGGEAY